MVDFKSKESRLIKKMLEDNNGLIQLVSVNSSKPLICIGEARIQTKFLTVAYVTNEQSICMGHIGPKHIIIPSTEEEMEISVLIDRRKAKNREFYISYNDISVIYSEESDPSSSSELVLIYLETENFVQLTVFNNALDQKVTEISADSSRAIRNIRIISHNILNLLFPGQFTSILEETVKVISTGEKVEKDKFY
jgi:hypothetical protein